MQRKTVNQAGEIEGPRVRLSLSSLREEYYRSFPPELMTAAYIPGLTPLGSFTRHPVEQQLPSITDACMLTWSQSFKSLIGPAVLQFELLYNVCISSFVFISLRRGYGSPLKKWINPDMCQFNLLLTIWFEEISCIFNLQLNKFHFPPLMDPLNYVLRLINLFWIKNV